MILTRNQSFGSWGEVFDDSGHRQGDPGPILHLAIAINISGNSYRLKDKLTRGGENSVTVDT
jgi:DNA replication protein DnaC